MTDQIETIQGATVQHGPKSGRVFMKELGNADPAHLIPKLAELAVRNNYPKVFAKVPASESRMFYRCDYRREAAIPDFYDGEEAALFLSSLPRPAQHEDEPAAAELDEIMVAAREHQNRGIVKALPKDAVIRKCGGKDAAEMARLYKTLLPACPLPVHDTDYLIERMLDESHYFGVEIKGALVALAAGIVDTGTGAAELTGFATLPAWRGHDLSSRLIQTLEKSAQRFGIQTVYALVCASVPDINISFARLGYAFGGRLTDQTRISEQTESTNVWHKNLQFKQA